MIFYGENSEVINLGLVYKSPITEQQLKEQVTSQQNEAALEVIRESVRTEKQARIDADGNLKNELRDYVDSETSAREISETNIVVRIDRETSLRIAADDQLSNDIAIEERARTAEILRLDDALENERVARATSESAMKSDIMTAISEMEGRNTNADSALTEAINSEARTRAAEDSSLSNALEAERVERAGAVSSLRTELQTAINANNTTRIAAENELADDIDAEALTRANEDTRLQGAITQEGTTRQNAINQLQSDFQTAINNEKTAREQAIANLNSSWAGGAGAFAPIESPSFTGVPKTTALDDSSDPLQIAPKSYVDNKLTAISENLSVFTSPTATKAGKQGQVPAPEKGSAVKILTNFGWRSPNDATVTSNTIPSQSGSLTYNGNVQEPSWVNFDESKLAISGTTSASAAGTYTAIFTPIDLYLWGDTLDQSPREVTWEIGKLRLTKPTATNTAFTYDQTAHAPTVSNYSSNYMSQTGTASATNKGNYTLNYTLKDTNNTCWNDGTASKVTLNWSIAVNKLTKPSVSKTEYDYTGSTITLSVSGFVDKYMSQTGTASSTAVGNYTLTVALKDKTNTTWADNSTTDITFNWKISKKILSAEMSTGFAQTGSLTFNGNSQNVSISNYNSTYHTLGGTTSASNAGTYEATVSPAASYTWSDGTTTAKKVQWSIAPKKIAKPVASTTSFDYDGYSKTLTVTGYDSNTMTQTGSTTATAAASYSVTYALKNKTNYNWADGSTANVVINWEILMRTLSAAQSSGFAQEGTLTYTGSKQTVTIKNYSSTYHVLGGVTSATEVGTYVATISPIDTYKWNDGSTAAKEVTWSIGAKKLNKPTAAVTAIDYDSTSKTLGVVGYDSATMLQSGTIVASAVGSYSVAYNLKDKKNYTWSDGTTTEVKINWTIAKRTLTAEQSTGFSQDGTLTFNGSEQTVTVKNYSSSYHVLGGTLKSSSAGTFTATISPAITHTWADGTTTPKEITWAIAPMKITKPTASSLSFVYNGNSRNLQVSNYDSAYMTLTGTISESAVGEYDAKYTLKSKINYNWADGSVADVVITWRITRAPLTSAQSTFNVEGSYTFNGNNQNVQIAGYDSTYHDISGETSASESGSHAVTISPKSSYTWNDGSTAPKEVTWEIAKKAFAPPIAATTEFAYDKNEHELTITGYEPTYMNRTGTYKASGVGAYTVTFTLIDLNNTRWATTTGSSYSIEWSIGMTTVTIPTIQTSTFTYDGNSKSPTFNVPNAAAVVAGGSTSAVNAGNYTFTYELADTETTVWSDGSSSAKSFSWKINRKPLTTTQSSIVQSGTLNYNGSSQSVLPYLANYDSNYHSIGGQIIQTDAGSYVAQITPLANYAWNDGTFDTKPVVWKISAIKIAKPTAATTLFYADGTTKTLDVENYNENYMFQFANPPQGIGAGDYVTMYRLRYPNSVQWADGTIADITINWQIIKRKVAKPVPVKTEYEYTGDLIYLQFYPYDTTVVQGEFSPMRDVGKQFVSFSINVDYYEWDDGDDTGMLNIMFYVVKAKLPAAYDRLYFEDVTYSGRDFTCTDYMKYVDSDGNVITLTITDIAISDAVYRNKLSFAGTTTEWQAGTYSISVTPTIYFTWANGTQETRTLTWTIKPQPIDASYSDPHLDANGTDLLYTGSAQSPTLVGYNSTYVDMTGNISESDTGEYEITFTPKTNYAWSDGTTEAKTFRWSIYKNVYVKPNASAKYTYWSAGNTLAVNNFVADAMSQTGTATATDVGVYSAAYELKNTVSSVWDDGTTTPVTISWEIEPIVVPNIYPVYFVYDTYVELSPEDELEYTGSEFRIDKVKAGTNYYTYFTTNTEEYVPIDSTKYEITGTLSATDAGEYAIKIIPREGHVWEYSGGDVPISWWIRPKVIPVPVQKGELVYQYTLDEWGYSYDVEQSPEYDPLRPRRRWSRNVPRSNSDYQLQLYFPNFFLSGFAILVFIRL